MNSVTLINILNCIFIIIILYNIIYESYIIEGLTEKKKKIETKINNLEKDVKSIEKINPFLPCASLIPDVKNNKKKIKSMMNTVVDLKANCSRQNS